MPQIIGCAGQCRAGKDITSDFLKERLNSEIGKNHWQRSSFAKPVKEIFCTYFDKDIEYIEKWKVVKNPPTDLQMPVRQALQFIGDGFRKINPSVWVDICFRDNSNKIISDARYVSELKSIKENGGFTILVVRPKLINNDKNASEAEMKPFAKYAVAINRGLVETQLSGIKKFYANILATFGMLPKKPVGWEYLDFVLINDKTIDNLYEKIDEQLIPKIKEFFKEQVA